MGPPCRVIKYKSTSRKPVVRIKKPVKPPDRYSSSSESVDVHQLYWTGEDEEIQGESRPVKNPVEKLRKWVNKQRFIPHDLSDDFLWFFLSAFGYDLESAKDRLDRYFRSRQEPSVLYRDRDPLSNGNTKIFQQLYVLPMPDTTADGRKIILTGLIKPTPNYNQIDHVKALALVIDLLIWEKDFGFGDFEIVLDGRGFECPQLLENKVYNHRSIKRLLLDTIPGTLRSFYLLYPPCHVDNIADNRNGIWIKVVKSKQEMISYLPADILPLEFGGNLGHLGDLLEQWELHMVQSRDFFVNFEKKMINDYRRRLMHEFEIQKGKNWVHQLQLVEEEWEYKVQYYKMMKEWKPLKHPAFGSQRCLRKPKTPPPQGRVRNDCWKRAKEEEANTTFLPTPFYNGYAKQIRQAQLEAAQEKILELCRCFQNNVVAQDNNIKNILN